jgi:hypothetical protein
VYRIVDVLSMFFVAVHCCVFISSLSFVCNFYLDTMKQVYGIYKDGVVIEVTSTKDGDESGFYLQDFFDNLYINKEKAGASAHAVLFGAKNPKSILSSWEIVYAKEAELLAPRGGKRGVKDKKGTD